MSHIIRKPATISDVVFANPYTEKRVRQYASNKRHGNIILHGPPGTGKSTVARIIVSERKTLDGDQNDVKILPASELTERSMESLYAIWQFEHLGGSKKPYVIIEEVDQLSPKLQRHLRTVLDSTETGHVILTTNHIHSVDTPLVDRCDNIEMPAVNANQWHQKITDLVSATGLTISETALNGICQTCTGSARDLLRGVEDYILEHSDKP